MLLTDVVKTDAAGNELPNTWVTREQFFAGLGVVQVRGLKGTARKHMASQDELVGARAQRRGGVGAVQVCGPKGKACGCGSTRLLASARGCHCARLTGAPLLTTLRHRPCPARCSTSRPTWAASWPSG
jgi:hypothetical protein